MINCIVLTSRRKKTNLFSSLSLRTHTASIHLECEYTKSNQLNVIGLCTLSSTETTILSIRTIQIFYLLIYGLFQLPSLDSFFRSLDSARMTKTKKRKSTASTSPDRGEKKVKKTLRKEQIEADNNDEALKIHRLGPAPASSSSLVQRLPSTRASDAIQSMKSSWVNKQRVLIFSSRGISYLARHVMKNLRSLMAHSKSEPKAELRKNFSVLNEIAELRNCNKVLFFDMKKKRDLYLWMASVPDGPTVKFLVENLNTMEGLKLTGNCLRGSRPLLSFDPKFDEEPHWKLIKELFTQIFGTPKSHPKSQPFVDHVLTFSIVDHKIWFRNYQIVEENGSLAEIGPR